MLQLVCVYHLNKVCSQTDLNTSLEGHGSLQRRGRLWRTARVREPLIMTVVLCGPYQGFYAKSSTQEDTKW